jgi:excisionase family DNA binding protein
VKAQRIAPDPLTISPHGCHSPAAPELINAPNFLKVSEIAALLRLSKTAVYEAISDGRLPASKLGRSSRGLRVAKSGLAKWIGGESQ